MMWPAGNDVISSAEIICRMKWVVYLVLRAGLE